MKIAADHCLQCELVYKVLTMSGQDLLSVI